MSQNINLGSMEVTESSSTDRSYSNHNDKQLATHPVSKCISVEPHGGKFKIRKKCIHLHV